MPPLAVLMEKLVQKKSIMYLDIDIYKFHTTPYVDTVSVEYSRLPFHSPCKEFSSSLTPLDQLGNT